MSKVVTIQLEWKYSPKMYLEEPITIPCEACEGGCLEIKDGVAIAKINPEKYHSNSSIREVLTRQIENQLYAVLIANHKDFDLSKTSRADIREDEKKNYYLKVEDIVLNIEAEAVDLITIDKYGDIVFDTKKERLDEQNHLACLIGNHRQDGVLDGMLKSFHQSRKDPDNELVHLYEIRDALSNKFGSKQNAINKLGTIKYEWDELGKLANDPRIKQARHRGKSAGALRDASTTELDKARKSAQLLIEKYLEYLSTEVSLSLPAMESEAKAGSPQ